MTQAVGQSVSATARGIAERYMAVWNEPDAATRRGVVASLWAPDGVEYLEGGTKYRGHEELTERVAGAYEAFVATGKYDVRSAGDLTQHDDLLKFTVQLATPAGEVDWAARVFILIGPDGLILEDYHLTVQPLPA